MSAIKDDLPLRNGETATSYLSRLASWYGISSALKFSEDMLIDYHRLISGDLEAIGILAELTGETVERLVAHTPVRTEPNTYRLYGEILSIHTSPRSAFRVCPICASEAIDADSRVPPDAAVYSRGIWLISSVRNCEVHGCALVHLSLAKKRKHTHHDFSYLAGEAAYSVDELVDQVTYPPDSALQRYVRKRIAGQKDSGGFPDRLQFSAFETACLTLGKLTLHGSQATLVALTEQDLWQVREAGFEVLMRGEQGITDLIDQLHAENAKTYMRQYTARTSLKVFYDWLEYYARHPSFDEIKRIAAAHIFKTLPVRTGQVIFGHINPNRQVHSLKSASVELKIDQRSIQRIGAASGCLRRHHEGGHPKNILLDAAKIDALLSNREDLITNKQVQAYLGISHQFLRVMMTSNFLKPAFRDRSYQSKFGTIYRKSEIDAIFATLLAKAEFVNDQTEDAISFKHASKMLSMPYLKLLELVEKGEFTWVRRLHSQKIMDGILLPRSEICARQTQKPEGVIDQKELCRRLKLAQITVQRLIEANVLPNRQLKFGNVVARQFFEADIEAFWSEYSTARSVAEHNGWQTRFAAYRLAEAGLKAVFLREDFFTAIYKTADLRDAGML